MLRDSACALSTAYNYNQHCFVLLWCLLRLLSLAAELRHGFGLLLDGTEHPICKALATARLCHEGHRALEILRFRIIHAQTMASSLRRAAS